MKFQDGHFFSTKNKQEEIDLVIKNIMDRIVHEKNLKGKKIFFKPNLTFLTPKEGVTTNFKIIKAITKFCLENSIEHCYGESDAGAYAWTTKQSYEEHGYKKLEKEYGVEFLHLSELQWETLSFETKKVKQLSIDVVKNFQNIADFTISLPVIKTHAMTGISLGIKNLWGCVPNPMRMIYHQHINDYLPKLAKYYNLIGTIFDGTISLTGNGPMFGTPIFSNTIGYSLSPIKGDFITSKLMNVDPNSVGHLVQAFSEYGYNISDYDVKVDNEFENYNISKPWGNYSPSKTGLNYIEWITFKSKLISKIVFTSRLSPTIYRLFNLLKPKDQRNSSPKNKYDDDKRQISKF